MNKSRLFALSLLLSAGLSLPIMAADGPEPNYLDFNQAQTQSQTQAETDRNTMHMNQDQTQGSRTELKAPEPFADNNDPDDPEKAASGGNFWIMMPLLVLGVASMFLLFRKPMKSST